MNTIEAVIETMESANQPVPNGVVIPSEKVMRNRLRLQFEELFEQARAMGLAGTFEYDAYSSFIKHSNLSKMEKWEGQDTLDRNFNGSPEEHFFMTDTHEVNLVEILDACCDIRVVTDGTIATFGFHNKGENLFTSIFHNAFYRVHANNMTKFPTDLGWAAEQVMKLSDAGTPVQLVESIKYPGRFAFIDEYGKYKKPADFTPVSLQEFIPAEVADNRLLSKDNGLPSAN